MESGGGAYGAGKVGGAFNPVAFVQKPPAFLRIISCLFVIIVMSCVASLGQQPDKDGKDTCIYNNNSSACQYPTVYGLVGIALSIGFLVGEGYFERMSCVKTRKNFVLLDLGSSSFFAFISFVLFCFLCNQWNKSELPPNNVGASNARAAIAFAFFAILSWGASAFIAYQRFKQGVDAAFSTNFQTDNMQNAYPSYPGGPETDPQYQEPPFSGGQNARGPTDFQAPAY